MQQLSNHDFWIDYARALAGALMFSLPLLMTMETWWLGMYLERERIALFLLVLLFVLYGLSIYAGFRRTDDWRDDAIDALTAISAGVIVACATLLAFNVLSSDMAADELIGKIAILLVPASMGAIIASKQLGTSDENSRNKEEASYPGELFIMASGSLFFAFNVAPTEEMFLIAYMMSNWHAIALVVLSLLVMHAFVYSVGFRGQEARPKGSSFLGLAYRFTTPGYAVALLVSAYVLWTYGRFDDLAPHLAVSITVVLGFPAALGGAVARLVI
jgi:putative integral membrane protein (TIGR02587 family)